MFKEYLVNKIADFALSESSKVFKKIKIYRTKKKIQQVINKSIFNDYQKSIGYDEVTSYIESNKIVEKLLKWYSSSNIQNNNAARTEIKIYTDKYAKEFPNNKEQAVLMECILFFIIETIFKECLNENGEYIIIKTIVDEVVADHDHHQQEKLVIDRKDLDKKWDAFCKHISKKNIEIITGNNESIDTETFISRGNYKENIEKFFNEEGKSCFAILGQSGYGKTNLMYDYYEQFKLKYSSIFISLTAQKGNISDYLDKEMLEFSNEFAGYTSDDFFSNYKNKSILVYLDGIDECENIGYLQQNIVRILKRKPKVNVKFILSCRTEGDSTKIIKGSSLWEKFLLLNGRESVIKKELSDHIIELTILNSEEKKVFWNKYSTKYNVSVEEKFNYDKISGLNIPYFISMACEVFENKTIKQNIEMKDLYSKWFVLKYSMFENSFDAEVILSKLAMLCLANEEVILKSNIKNDVELVSKYDIIEKFGRIGILKSGLNDRGETQWRFVNFEMMMYVIFFDYLELNKKSFLDVVTKLNEISEINKTLVLRGTVFYLMLMYSQMIEDGGPNNIPFENYVNNEKNISCGVCDKYFKQDEEVTYIYSFESGLEVKAFDQGTFCLSHKSCLKETVSILVISDDKIRSMNISEFVAIGLISQMMPHIVERKREKLDKLYEKHDLEKFAVIAYKDEEKFHGVYEDNKFYILLYGNTSIANKYIPLLERKYVEKFGELPKYQVKRLTKEVYMDIISMSNGDVFIVDKFSTSSVKKKPRNLDL